MLNDPDTMEDPLPNSLFNLDTLKKIIELGQAAPSIFKDEIGNTWGQSFNLTEDQEWVDLSNSLGLNVTTVDQAEDPEIGVKRTYLMWLWMETLFNTTIQRLDETGGSFQMGILGTLGGTAFQTEMTTMNLEFPMLTMAKQMQLNL